MKRTILLMAVCLCFIGKASAQWVVSDPGNLAQGIINTTKQIVQTSTTAKNTLDGFMEAQKIFQQGKKYYDALKVVNVTGMSLTDAERLAVINNAYKSLLNYRNLVNYYTRKNISVSYLRAKKKNDTDRVLALYGSADERYW